jgi:hypothetical protein
VWMGGSAGILLHWDGSSLESRQGALGRNDLSALWGSRAGDLWAGGADLHHFDGTAWRQERIGAFSALAGSSASDVWALSAFGELSHYDGNTWSTAADFGGAGRGLTADAPGSCWVSLTDSAGNQHWLGRGDGGIVDIDAGALTLFGMWSRSPDDVWVGGEGHRLFHFDGGSWALARTSSSSWPETFNAGAFIPDSGSFIAVGDSNSAYEPPMEFDLPRVSDSQDFLGVWAAAADDVWAVGRNGGLVHRGDAGWRSLQSGETWPLWGLESSGTTVRAYGNEGKVLKRGARGWALEATPGSVRSRLVRMWRHPGGGIVVGDDGVILRQNGDEAWTVETVFSAASGLRGVWGTSPDDVWAVGLRQNATALLLHRSDAGWTAWPVPDAGVQPWKVHGVDATHAWIVGENGAIWELDATGTWNAVTHDCTPYALYGVWAASATRAWAVGSDGICRLENGQWVDDRGGLVLSGVNLFDVWGLDENLVFAVGEYGVMYQRVGGVWSEVQLPTRQQLEGVRGLRTADGGYELWVSGNGGTILHRSFP